MTDAELIAKARQIAVIAHEGQMRKYVDEKFDIHPDRVATSVAKTGAKATVIAGCHIHDVWEDTDYPPDDILAQLGIEPFYYMVQMTNPSKILKKTLRADRKALDRLHLMNVCNEVKLIKLADRVDNLKGIKDAPEKFRRLYAEESLLLLRSLRGINKQLEDEYIALLKDVMGVEEYHKTRILG